MEEAPEQLVSRAALFEVVVLGDLLLWVVAQAGSEQEGVLGWLLEGTAWSFSFSKDKTKIDKRVVCQKWHVSNIE